MSTVLMLRAGRGRWLQAGLVLLAFAASSMAMAHGQDLASLARKERERRAKITKPAKVLTEDDGKAATEAGAGSLTMVSPTESSTPAQAEPRNSGASLEAQEGAWRTRATSVRSALARAEGKLKQLESDLVVIGADIAPLSAAEAQDPLRLQKKVQRIAELNQQITAQKAAITAAKSAVAAFEVEARSNGVPAGWLR